MEYNEAIKKVNKWNIEYYTKSSPTVADKVYDKWKRFIEDTEKSTGIIDPNSPSQKVGGTLIDKFKKVKHNFPMLSISNAMNIEEIQKFGRRFDKDTEFTVEWKIDGIGVALRYNDGKLIKAITRGNGGYGEDITHNVKTVPNIPNEIPYKGNIEFRGELHMYQHVFNKKLEKAEKEGTKIPANSRNVVSGAMKRKQSSTNHGIVATIYTIPNPLDHNITSQTNVLEFIKKQGFSSNNQLGKGKIEDMIRIAKESEETRKTCGFDVDGLVIKVNSIEKWEEIGYNNTAPKFFIAYKFPELPVETIILDIYDSVGKNKITPVAKVKRVWVSGSYISNVTLHNYDYIEKHNINVGDVITIYKSGGVIPKFNTIVKKVKEGFYKAPTHCPACNHKLEDVNCINPVCKGRILSQMISYVSTKKLNIMGIGDKALKKLVDSEQIKDVYDLLTLNENNFISAGLGRGKGVQKILNNIQKARELNLGKYIAVLNIPHIGSTYGKVIEKYITDITELKSYGYYKELGNVANKSIQTYNNDDLINKLSTIIIKKVKNVKGITGKSLKRTKNSNINKKWETYGGTIVDNDPDLEVRVNITPQEIFKLIADGDKIYE